MKTPALSRVGPSWALVAPFIAFVVASSAVIKTVLLGQQLAGLAYNQIVLLPNYIDHGFVRRGLGGTIYWLLDRNILLFHLASALWISIPAAILLRDLNRVDKVNFIWFAVALVLSPQLFMTWMGDVGRPDMMACGFIGWSVLCALRRRYVLATVPLLAGYLVHETTLIYGAPLLFSIWGMDYWRGESSLRSLAVWAAMLLSLLLVLVLLQSRYDLQLVARQLMSQEAPSYERDLSLYIIGGGIRALVASHCMTFSRNANALLFASCLFVFLLYVKVYIIRSKESIAAVGISSLLPLCFMLVMGGDYGRWLSLGIMNAWLASMSLRLKGLEKADTRRTDYGWAAAMLLALLVLRPGGVQESTGTTAAVARRIWERPQTTLSPSLEKCDPTWKSVIHR